MRVFVVLILSFFNLTQIYAKTIALEYIEKENPDYTHSNRVEYIACKNALDDCGSYLESDFLNSFEVTFSQVLKAKKIDVVNISVIIQASPNISRPLHLMTPEEEEGSVAKQRKKMAMFMEKKKTFDDLVLNNPTTLFVAASGNGYKALLGRFTPGVPVKKFPVYPAYYNYDNIISVAAIDSDKTEKNKLDTYALASYSNYGISSIDVASHIEAGEDGTLLTGTSFAAPVISRLANQLIVEFALSPLETKKIIMLSAYVKNLDRNIELAKELNDNGKESLLYRIENESNISKRDKLLQQIGDVILVKSGGIAVKESALECARIYKSTFLNLPESCLEAQKRVLDLTDENADKLKTFWELRELY